MKTQFDILVIGGGPGGQNAAYNLAKAGVSVCLIEADKLPKDKVCGGGLRFNALHRFPYLEPIIRKVSRSTVRKITVYSHKLRKVTVTDEHAHYYLMRRLDFSYEFFKLCEQAGVRQLLGTRVREVIIGKDQVAVYMQTGEEITARAIIGADGVNSLVAKAAGLNLGWPVDHYAFASEQEMQFDIGLPNDEIIVSYGFQNIPGYGWVFPKGNYVNVGIGFISTYKGASLKQVHESYVRFLKEERILPENFPMEGMRSWAIPWGGALKKTYGQRVLLVGDAAGLIQPLTAEGIYYALTSGEHAARVMEKAVRENDYSEEKLSSYQKLWHDEFGVEFKTLLGIQKFIFRHMPIVDTAIKYFKNDAEAHKYLLDFFSGRMPFHQAKIKLLPKISYLLVKQRVKSALRLGKTQTANNA